MYKPVPPCKDCESRHLGCHADCEKYLSYREEQLAFNKMVQEEKIKNCRLTDIQWIVYRKHHKSTMG